MSDLQVPIDVVSNYPLIKQLTNPRADFCSLILSFLLPLSYCDKVGWVCIIFFLFSGTRRRRVGTNFRKGCPNGRNPRERERERERNAVSKLGTRKKTKVCFDRCWGKYHLYSSSGGRFSLLGIQNRQVRG
jgi:hypothetical protein